MAFLAFYALRGFELDYLLNLELEEKIFLFAAMELEIERVNREVER